jgi:hypothetical protein
VAELSSKWNWLGKNIMVIQMWLVKQTLGIVVGDVEGRLRRGERTWKAKQVPERGHPHSMFD